MKENMRKKLLALWNRVNNKGSIIALVSTLALLINQFKPGMVDLVWLDATLNIGCTFLIILGILNDPKSPGLDNPTK